MIFIRHINQGIIMNNKLSFSLLIISLSCIPLFGHEQLTKESPLNITLKDFPTYSKKWEDRSKGTFCTKVLSNQYDSAIELFTKKTYLSHDIYTEDGPKEASSWLSGLCIWLGLQTQEYNYHFEANSYYNEEATPFEHKNIITEDDLKLEAFVREVQQPKFTIVVNSGFLPGIMYGMLSLVAMLPKDCNVVLYNNRGKGSSQGSMGLQDIQNYGHNEYQDAAAALKFAHELNKTTPVVAYGICAGAFHLEKALCAMGSDRIKQYNICGVFYDSAVTSIQDTLINLPQSQYPSGWLAPIKRGFLWFLRYTIFRENFMAQRKQTSLDPVTFGSMNIPTHHLYAQHDHLTKAQTIETHIEHHQANCGESKCTTTKFAMCEIKTDKPVSHANGILQRKKEYSEVLGAWICARVNNFNQQKKII
jgi:hypothetical protein